MAKFQRIGHLVLTNVGFDTFNSRQPIPVDVASEIVETNQSFPDHAIPEAKIKYPLNLPSIFGDGSDGTLAIASGTTTLNTVGKNIYQYAGDLSISGTAKLTIGANLQNVPVFILVQGDLNITSSDAKAVDWSGLGGQKGLGHVGPGDGTFGTPGSTVIIPNGGTVEPAAGAGIGGGGGGGYGHEGGNGQPSLVNRGKSNTYSPFFSLTRLLSDLFIGGGGAGGSNNGVGLNREDGGNGGGCVIFIVQGNINITSAMTVAGDPGLGSNDLNNGGGGGGGGGFLGIFYLGNVIANTSVITVTGGAKGLCPNGQNGGDGGAGQSVIRKMLNGLDI